MRLLGSDDLTFDVVLYLGAGCLLARSEAFLQAFACGAVRAWRKHILSKHKLAQCRW